MTTSTNIGRKLELLACLIEQEANTGRGLGVVSVSERVGREKTQISRGLAALAREGLVERNDETLEFSAGRALLALAARAGAPELLALAQPVLERLTAALGERSDLAVLHDGQVLTVESVASASSVQAVGWTGRRTPLHCTAAGRVLLGGHTDEAIAALVGPEPLSWSGPNAPIELADLLGRIRAAKVEGVAVADRELDVDVVAVACPVVRRGAVVAAVTVACPEFRVQGRLEDVVAAVRAAAGELCCD
ncbi:MAG: IclR family transcriptional regulator [Actinomycetota bacterium]